MPSKHTSSDELDDILFDNIVAVGVREEGTVRDLDTLIIDRQKTVDALEAYISKHYILKADVVEAIKINYFERGQKCQVNTHILKPKSTLRIELDRMPGHFMEVESLNLEGGQE